MPKIQVNRKERILYCGGANYKAILDQESGLAYSYENPDVIIAVFDKNRWIMAQRPHYSSGGWGSGSSGRVVDGHLHENVEQMLKAVDAKIVRFDIPEMMSQSDIAEYVKRLEKINEARRALCKAENGDPSDYYFEKVPDMIRGDVRNTPAKGSPARGMDVMKTLEDYETALQVFIEGKGKRINVGGYLITPNSITFDRKVVAFRDEKGQVFMNSELLPVTKFEKAFLGGESVIQNKVREISKYNIPFNVLESAKLKLNETKVVEAGPAEDFQVNGSNRHFTGALLLENHGRRFLMDVDRREIKHGIFNAFFVEVNGAPKTIAEAYETMKPQEVKDAEANGIQVERQGEWFFIATEKTVKVSKDRIMRWGRDEDGSMGIELANVSHGKGRPNSLYRVFNSEDSDLENLVCGTVSHSGREHKDLNLGVLTKDGEDTDVHSARNARTVWTKDKTTGEDTAEDPEFTFKLWKLVPNTTVGNFTIQGDVD